MNASGCAAVIYPDLILRDEKLDLIILKIERERKGSFNWGLKYVLKPMESRPRKEILSKLKACPDIDCKLNELMARKLYLDALSLV
ncbi:MAG: hypothetical protein AAFX87_22085 [Bacteroidota bacterium]